MPTTDLSSIDTTPGSGHLFSPPADFAGGEEEFGTWLKGRFDTDGEVQQYMVIVSRHLCGRSHFPLAITVTGPFAQRFKAACRKLDAWSRAAA